MVHRVSNLEAMNGLAKDVAGDLKVGDVLLLAGPLGAGKTTFTQALALALGVKESVTSPTYTLVAEYDTAHEKIKQLIHVDLYRLSREELVGEQAVSEVLDEAGEGDRVTIIEWADKLANPPAGATSITFEHGANESERVVTIGDRVK